MYQMHEQTVKLIIKSKLEQIPLVSSAVKGICQTVVQNEEMLYHLVLCVTEGVTNVINHAYHLDPDKIIEIAVTINSLYVIFEIIDSGEKTELPKKAELNFNPIDIDSLPESGMGLFLIYNIMDEATFSQNAEGKNVFWMKKYIKDTYKETTELNH